ncbi:hypothetical protein KJ632_02260 [Patescibacteria group bacterium]|nr:hypothetical protein [Patescibacteria group bacterium]
MPQGDDKNQKHDRNDHQKKNPAKKDNSQYAAKMWEHINKEKAKDNRDKLKNKVNGNRSQKPPQKSKEEKPSRPSKQEPKPLHQTVSPQSEVSPVNPFAPASENVQTPTALPTNTHEEQRAEDLKDMEPGDEGDADFSNDQLSVNPFAPVSAQQDKPLNTKPLENKPFSAKPVVEKKEEKAEEKGHAVEEVSVVNDVKKKEDEQEVSVVEVKNEPGKAESGEDIEEFKEEFWDVLDGAGITKGRIVGFVIFMIIAVIGVFWYFSGNSDGGEVKVKEVKVVEGGTEKSQPVADERALEFSYMIGLEYVPRELINAVPVGYYGDTAGIMTSLELGRSADEKQFEYKKYVSFLRKLENIYNVELYNYLDQSTNRREALDDHIAEMAQLIETGTMHYNLINQQLQVWDGEYEYAATQRQLYEEAFFKELNELKGETSYEYLVNFIEHGSFASEIKAYYSAYTVLKQMYANAINALNPRYDDIVANRDALVKGVKVFDLPQSDIRSIIRIEN